MPLAIGAQGVSNGLRGNASNEYALAAGSSWVIPGGAWNIRCGPYTTIQTYDPQLGIWLNIGDDGNTNGSVGGGPQRYVNSDGVNFRVMNQTGCAAGALITTAGSAMTNGIGTAATGVTVTPSSGSSVWSPIVGGALNTTVTISNGGTNYDYAPILIVDGPPQGGIPATMTCTVSAGVINAVTVTNQGAGYTSAPNITIVRDPRDDSGANGLLVAALTGSGTLTGLLCTNHGTALTSVPTLTFSSGGSAATVIMVFTITAYVVATAGSGYLGATEITGLGGFPATAAVLTNPATQRNLVRERRASIRAALSTVTITATGQVVDDGGIYAGIPTALIITSPIATLTTAAGITFTVGGVSDVFWLNPA